MDAQVLSSLDVLHGNTDWMNSEDVLDDPANSVSGQHATTSRT